MSHAAPPPLLDRALLDAYEDRLRKLGVPVDEWGRPGLSEDEIEATLAPLGLRLPVEGRTWWSWHNGAIHEGSHAFQGPYAGGLLTLDQAVETYHGFRKTAEQAVEPTVPELAHPEDWWHPSWFPINGPQLPSVIDCSTPEGEPTPVRFIDYVGGEWSVPRARSLGEVIAWRIRALDSGGWQWDKSKRKWSVKLKLLDPEFRMNPVV